MKRVLIVLLFLTVAPANPTRAEQEASGEKTQPSAAPSEPEASTISAHKPEHYSTYPTISIPLRPDAKPRYYDMILRENPTLPKGGLQERVFREKLAGAGEELKINAYLVSNNIIESFDRFEKGDAPTPEKIKDVLNRGDETEFIHLMARLAEQRRAAKNANELGYAAQGSGGTSDLEFNDYLFSTGYFEVQSPKLKDADPDVRYFVPVKEILLGQGVLDLKNAKLEVMRGMTVFLLKQISADPANPFTELADRAAGLYLPEHCSLPASAKPGEMLAQMHEILRVGGKEMLTPESDLVLNHRKQACMLKLFYQACPDAPDAHALDFFMKREKINCARPKLWLRGLKKFH